MTQNLRASLNRNPYVHPDIVTSLRNAPAAAEKRGRFAVSSQMDRAEQTGVYDKIDKVAHSKFTKVSSCCIISLRGPTSLAA